MQLFGNFGGSRVDGQQALQLLHRQVRLAGLRVDLRQVLGGGAVALVELQGAAQLRDGGAPGARVRGRLPEQRPPERGAEVGLVGDQPRRLAQRLDRLVVTARLQVLEARPRTARAPPRSTASAAAAALLGGGGVSDRARSPRSAGASSRASSPERVSLAR